MCSWTRWALLPLWGLPLVLCPAACWCVPSLAGLAGFTFCARGAGSEHGEPGRNDRRRVQSVLWGGAPAPVGLMPLPRRGGCHCMAMGARRCDRCRGRVMLLPMSAAPLCGALGLHQRRRMPSALRIVVDHARTWAARLAKSSCTGSGVGVSSCRV